MGKANHGLSRWVDGDLRVLRYGCFEVPMLSELTSTASSAVHTRMRNKPNEVLRLQHLDVMSSKTKAPHTRTLTHKKKTPESLPEVKTSNRTKPKH